MFVGAAQFLVGMLLAEALYPGYSISGNYISDLGAYCPQSNAWTNYAGPCVVHQPTAIIFDSSVFLLGLLVAVAAYLFSRSVGRNVFSVLLVLTGVGAMGVGVFPETAPLAHELTSDVAFIFAALAAVWSYRLVKAPLNYFSGILGAVSLAAIVLDEANVTAGLGVGGIERMIVYPVIVWAVGFGAYAMAPGLRVPPGPFPPSAPEWTGRVLEPREATRATLIRRLDTGRTSRDVASIGIPRAEAIRPDLVSPQGTDRDRMTEPRIWKPSSLGPRWDSSTP